MDWYASLSSAGGVAVIGGIFGLIKWGLERRAKKRDGNKKTTDERLAALEESNHVEIAGVRTLLCIAIKEKAKEALAAGYISAEDLSDLTREHDLYHNELGGNGFLSSLMEKVYSLPVKD